MKTFQSVPHSPGPPAGFPGVPQQAGEISQEIPKFLKKFQHFLKIPVEDPGKTGNSQDRRNFPKKILDFLEISRDFAPLLRLANRMARAAQQSS